MELKDLVLVSVQLDTLEFIVKLEVFALQVQTKWLVLMAFLLEQTHSVVVNVVLDILVTTVKPKISVQLPIMAQLASMARSKG